ncbi:MAG: glycosyltransferase family 4 protein [Gammaproteobacteria bacterium]|nr:glycosyltransferase family 4 protein [Gammaproteobacteria bacterium]
MKICYLTTEYPKVSHTFIRREILELERRGHEVLRVAIRNAGGAIADDADRREAERTIHCLSLSKRKFIISILRVMLTRAGRWLSALRMTLTMSRASERGLLRHLAYLAEASVLLHILAKHGISHTHVHFGTNAAAVARLIDCLGGPSYSMTIHGPGEFDAPLGFSLSEKVEEAAFVVAISNFCYSQLCRWVSPEHWQKIHVVRCSVDGGFFESETSVNGSSRLLLSIGRLTAQKGQLLLLDAMRQLVAAGDDVRLVLAGDGKLRPMIEERIVTFGLQRHVTVTGWVDEATVRMHLQEARVLVQPSFAEGLPVVIMEALAMGRPVISTYVAGIPELVRPGENGWLVTAGNVDELVSAIREALDAPAAQLTSMGRAGRERVRARHHVTTEVETLETLLRAAASGVANS